MTNLDADLLFSEVIYLLVIRWLTFEIRRRSLCNSEMDSVYRQN